MKPALLKLADKWDKDAAAYKAQAPIAAGSLASDITQTQQDTVNAVGALRNCAYELRNLVKSIDLTEGN